MVFTSLFWWQTCDKKVVSSLPCIKLLYMHRSLLNKLSMLGIVQIYRKVEKRGTLYTLIQFPTNICIFHAYMICLIKLRNHIDTPLLTKLQTLFVWHQLFHWGLFSVSGPVQSVPVPLFVISPESHLMWDSFQIFPCFSWPWQFERAQVMYFLDCPSV